MEGFVNLELFVAVVVGLAVVAMASYCVIICIIVGDSKRKSRIISRMKRSLEQLKQRQQKMEHDLGACRYQSVPAHKYTKDQQLLLKAAQDDALVANELAERKDATQHTDFEETPQSVTTKAASPSQQEAVAASSCQQEAVAASFSQQEAVDRALEEIMKDIVSSQQQQTRKEEDYANCGDQEEDYANCGDQEEDYANCGDQEEDYANCGDQEEDYANCGDQEEDYANCGDQEDEEHYVQCDQVKATHAGKATAWRDADDVYDYANCDRGLTTSGTGLTGEIPIGANVAYVQTV